MVTGTTSDVWTNHNLVWEYTTDFTGYSGSDVPGHSGDALKDTGKIFPDGIYRNKKEDSITADDYNKECLKKL